ncbi:tetratricopeptide repeat protein [Reichenbachiella ulvae]|uniref:Tetratricopeptide repeat protein n=1 Tax=Reichenbachiella ulvae TaxID=2980104 RepID=A0ABT3CTC1_9BACT|nr:tetratricopeptide repeat protein [Reichenbachiella ulvae]MCV9386882.1 tetratricopeptide repeat protein [Reichenbachiella ulvae]
MYRTIFSICLLVSHFRLLAQNPADYDSKSEMLEAASAYYEKGNDAVTNTQYELGVIYYDSAINLVSDNADYYISRGQAKELEGDAVGALIDYEYAYNVDQSNHASIFKRALIYYNQEQYKKAAQDFTFLINNTETYETKALIFKGVSYNEDGAAKLSGITTIHEMKADVYIHRGMTYEKLGYNTPAMLDYDKAIDLNPYDPNYYVYRGMFRLDRGDKDGAVLDYRKALKINPHHRNALYNLSFLVDEEERDQINQILFGQGDFAKAYSKRAFENFQKGAYEEALLDYDSALMIKADNGSDLMNRGIVKSKMENYKSAIDDFNSSIYVDNTLLRNYVLIGNAYQELGDYGYAIKYYNRYIDNAGPDGSVYYNLGLALMKYNDDEEACLTFRKAIEYGEERAEKPMDKVCFSSESVK